MHCSIELPESVYTELIRAAQASGTTPAGWIADHLPKYVRNGKDVSDAELAAADAALRACMVSMGRPIGTDNEQIDADLAREYGDDHADLYRPAEGK
jgi:hypothetical protein